MPVPGSKRAKVHPHPIYVYIWFDVEDYVTEESDSLPLTALSILKKYDARATCKMVAEKVRVLLERRRTDVIAAIAEHDVGYHLDTHSRHPTVYEYLAGLDALEGAEEFMAREREGLKLVEKVFGRRASCFGHPGPAWAPHFYPALPKMGIPVYLDETSMVNLDDGPYWYCGVLNLNGANRNFVKFDYTFEEPDGIDRLKRRFRRIHDRLRGEGRGGAVSFLFHLHTAINREFWDAVNFSRGENRRREEYVRPTPQTAEVTKRAWSDFEEIVRYMASFEDVRFITASDASKIYRREEVPYDAELTGSVLRRLGEAVKHVRVRDGFASPSELFYLVTKCLADYSREGRLPPRTLVREPFGPAAMKPSKASGKVRASDLMGAAAKALDYMDSGGRLPSSVELEDGGELSTADFMATAGRLLLRLISTGTLPEEVRVVKGRFLQSRYVRPEVFREACGWTVLPEGFEAPEILQQMILQTWTLKPATQRQPASRTA